MAIDLSKSRRRLPATMLDRSSYSIFSVIKQAIGKDLTRFSIPVIWNEPLSFLQRLVECLQYSSLLDQAALATSSIERFHLINAFIVSGLSSNIERMSKPFNPLLGETYELKNEDPSAPFHYIAEQVSHHPPISALYARGQNWILTANIEPKMKFQGTNVVALSEGRWILRITKKSTISRSASQSSFHSCHEDEEKQEVDEPRGNQEEEEEYTWRSPSVFIHNILFGRLWCEFQGQIDLERVQSNQRAVLTIKTHSWFATQATKTAELFKFNGFIYDGTEKISAFHGNYAHCYYAIDDLNDADMFTSTICSIGGNNCLHLNSNSSIAPACDLPLTRSSRLIWHRSLSFLSDDEQRSQSDYYFFTPFAMSLNELNHSSSLLLPPTDCRYRQDIRYLEEGNLEDASMEKHRLEEQQRADARNRLDEYQSLWFKKDEHNEYIYTGEYERRIFEHCPKLFSQIASSQ